MRQFANTERKIFFSNKDEATWERENIKEEATHVLNESTQKLERELLNVGIERNLYNYRDPNITGENKRVDDLETVMWRTKKTNIHSWYKAFAKK